MRKALIGLTAFGSFLFLVMVLWVVGRLTNTFQYYRMPSVANEPAIHLEDKFFASKLLSPKRLDFITYYGPLPGDEHTIFTHRLCGLEGDTLEIRRGQLFVNGQNLDAGLHLVHHYAVARADYARLPRTLYVDSAGILPQADSLYHLGLPDAEVVRQQLPAKRQILPLSQPDYQISKQYGKAWNQDNFGPLVIPAGSYFVLGDNRQNAMDSRYTGLLKKSNYLATVLGH